MKWKNPRRSQYVEDRRGGRSAGPSRRKGGVRVGGVTLLIIAVIYWLMGGNPLELLTQTGGTGGGYATDTEVAGDIPAGDEQAEFVSYVMADLEDTWTPIFRQYGLQYQPPTLVLYEEEVQSACGFNTAATGPFYCPADQKVYIDLSFFRQLAQMGGAGDFAQAYVLGHEVGHHVQTLLGTSRKVRSAQQRARSQADVNALSVLMELQADCYAGLWAHHAEKQRDVLEDGDVEEGLNAAAAIGDDRLQSQAGRRINPDSFTHGTSAQRAQWLREGLSKGTLEACDCFGREGVRL